MLSVCRLSTSVTLLLIYPPSSSSGVDEGFSAKKSRVTGVGEARQWGGRGETVGVCVARHG